MQTTNTSTFKALFGVNEDEIQKYCILMPFIVPAVFKTWQVSTFSNGFLYRVAQTPHFTLIHTRMGAGLVGDAVLYLKQTPCSKLILFGSCGLLGGETESRLRVGDIVIPVKCYALESFSEFLIEPGLLGDLSGRRDFSPHSGLLEDFLKHSGGDGGDSNDRDEKSNGDSNSGDTDNTAHYSRTTCATVASLKLEEEKLPLLIQAGLQIVDMECSAFYAAAGAIGIPALALFWISDCVKSQPFYFPQTADQKSRITSGITTIAKQLAGYCAYCAR